MARRKAEPMYSCRFKVRGTGVFPVDMLRFDRCFPVSESDSVRIYYHRGDDPRDVELEAVSVGNPEPTPARWRSFSWEVVEVDGVEVRRG